jgi:hypothetical protein
LNENIALDNFDLGSVWTGNYSAQAKKAHLYLAKIFADRLAEHHVPIDVQQFSDAILNDQPHPYLRVRFSRHNGKKYASSGLFDALHNSITDECVCLSYLVTVSPLCIQIIWVHQDHELTAQGWHPDTSERRILLRSPIQLADLVTT